MNLKSRKEKFAASPFISLSPLNGYDGLLPNILTILTYTVSGNEIFIILYFSAEILKLKTENMNFSFHFNLFFSEKFKRKNIKDY